MSEDDIDLSEEAVARREGSKRKLAAKRNNERVKLFVTTINAIALATFGAAAILPTIGDAGSPNWIWIPVAVALHLMAQGAYRLLRSED